MTLRPCAACCRCRYADRRGGRVPSSLLSKTPSMTHRSIVPPRIWGGSADSPTGSAARPAWRRGRLPREVPAVVPLRVVVLVDRQAVVEEIVVVVEEIAVVAVVEAVVVVGEIAGVAAVAVAVHHKENLAGNIVLVVVGLVGVAVVVAHKIVVAAVVVEAVVHTVVLVVRMIVVDHIVVVGRRIEVVAADCHREVARLVEDIVVGPVVVVVRMIVGVVHKERLVEHIVGPVVAVVHRRKACQCSARY